MCISTFLLLILNSTGGDLATGFVEPAWKRFLLLGETSLLVFFGDLGFHGRIICGSPRIFLTSSFLLAYTHTAMELSVGM